MEIVPSLDLRHGRVSQWRPGEGQAEEDRPSPGEQAQAWRAAGAAWVQVVDVDAALGEPVQWRHLSGVLEARLRVQFGGGIRRMVQVQQLLDLGVERVVVGTQAVLHPDWARELAKVFPRRVVLALDCRGREVLVQGRREGTGQDVVEVARSLDEAGLAGFLYRPGEGPLDRETVRALRSGAPRTPLTVFLPQPTGDDLAFLEAQGVAAVVLGEGLFSGGTDLEGVLRRFPPARPPRPASPDTLDAA